MKRTARTKIIATLGPSSNSYTVLRKMVLAGMDVARLNFSHGTDREHLHRIETIKKINEIYKRHVRILQDLEGYRIRIGRFKHGDERNLIKGTAVWLSPEARTDDKRVIPFDYKGNLNRIKNGQLVYIDDGNIILKVKKTAKKDIKLEVIEGGRLKERKGINIPGVRIPFSGVTPKDKEDIKFGIRHRVDYVAQSFVRTKKDITIIKELLTAKSPQTRVIAKIEAREAIRNIDEIIDVSDGIMVARGDMGIAIPIYEIPVVQKIIIRKCNRKKKFVITATEMLEHMTEHPRPTRAEVTDVANAILDGTDFAMLSAETAVGEYPIKAVKMMDQIIKYTEAWEK